MIFFPTLSSPGKYELPKAWKRCEDYENFCQMSFVTRDERETFVLNHRLFRRDKNLADALGWNNVLNFWDNVSRVILEPAVKL